MTIVLDKVTRVEVIDTTGRVFVGHYYPGVDVALQDDDRTLKVFTSEPLPGFAIPPDQAERDRVRSFFTDQEAAS